MRLLTISAEANPNFSKLSLSIASTHEEVREVQSLRYKVFIEAMGLPKLSNQDGLDQDEFDDYFGRADCARLSWLLGKSVKG